jgi:hypothetical protein
MFSKGINPRRRGRIDCTSQTFASLLDNSIAKANSKVDIIEKINIFLLEFFNHKKLTIEGGTKTIIIDKK